MATNWTTVDPNDIYVALARLVVRKSNEGTAADWTENQNLDPSDLTSTRVAAQVAASVAEFRAALRRGGKVPLSVTPGAVPPELHVHALNHASWRTIVSTPSLQMAVVTEKGVYSPFGDLYKEALKVMERAGAGENYTPPSDPCGQDYETAVSSSNPAIKPVVWGDYAGTDDEYAAGERVDPDTGTTTVLPVDMTL